jgi:hypothetical protein
MAAEEGALATHPLHACGGYKAKAGVYTEDAGGRADVGKMHHDGERVRPHVKHLAWR